MDELIKPRSSHESIMAEVAELRDALDHIARVARGSREQSRRIRWIALRADGALNGNDDWRTVDLPRSDDALRRKLKARVAELENRVAELENRVAELEMQR